jgi:hypothetical protein
VSARIAISTLFASASANAWACPNCATAQDVRAWMVQDHPVERLFVVVLPLLVLSIVVAVLERIGRVPQERS